MLWKPCFYKRLSGMASRAAARLWIGLHAARASVSSVGRRKRPANPKRILVAHHLLLGDTLMLTPLLAKLRGQYPGAELVMTAPKAIAPLYQRRPYGVVAWPFDPRDASTLRPMLDQRGFDLAIVPGDNRHSWLALALGARWIVAHGGDRPAYKSWPVDELIPYPSVPAAWGDMVAQLVEGPPPQPYQPSDWPAPDYPFNLPQERYAVLHVGASSPLKRWQPEKWRALAESLSQDGMKVVFSGGPGEEKYVVAVDPQQRYPSFAGKLDLPQLWQLLANATLLVCPDTGIAHLGRIVNTPTVVLFGPGSSVICGAGEFWCGSAYRAVTQEDFPCRDQRLLFKREIAWVRRCGRSPKECATAACMQAIELDTVRQAVKACMRPPSGMVQHA